MLVIVIKGVIILTAIMPIIIILSVIIISVVLPISAMLIINIQGVIVQSIILLIVMAPQQWILSEMMLCYRCDPWAETKLFHPNAKTFFGN